MSESFLHYLWQFQYFAKADLRTTSGEEILIFNPGIRNTHAGPDFHQARLKIDGIEWVGSVEIHIHASGWMDHKHDTDKAYDTVVLHVVWKNDKPVIRHDGSPMPTLELLHRVDERLILDYKKLVNSPEGIPCAAVWHTVPSIVKLAMLDKVLASRLEAKAIVIETLLKRNGHDWEETCYQLLARNFGFKVNAEPFLQLAQGLPLKTLLKHADKPLQVEALLFGQAGFLEDKLPDDHYLLLQREYRFLCNKYDLGPARLNKVQWKFLRLRPANFPTIRLAQLGTLLHEQRNVFSRIMAITHVDDLKKMLSIQQPVYWRNHYHFGKKVESEISALGDASMDMIIINTIVPLMVAFGKYKDDQNLVDRALSILQSIPSESNAIVRQWATLGVKSTTAFDSQALLELYQHFCQKRRCLSCSIGVSLLKPAQV